jgi:hypothetical protein
MNERATQVRFIEQHRSEVAPSTDVSVISAYDRQRPQLDQVPPPVAGVVDCGRRRDCRPHSVTALEETAVAADIIWRRKLTDTVEKGFSKVPLRNNRITGLDLLNHCSVIGAEFESILRRETPSKPFSTVSTQSGPLAARYYPLDVACDGRLGAEVTSILGELLGKSLPLEGFNDKIGERAGLRGQEAARCVIQR